jgi:hypothetical protein
LQRKRKLRRGIDLPQRILHRPPAFVQHPPDFGGGECPRVRSGMQATDGEKKCSYRYYGPLQRNRN